MLRSRSTCGRGPLGPTPPRRPGPSARGASAGALGHPSTGAAQWCRHQPDPAGLAQQQGRRAAPPSPGCRSSRPHHLLAPPPRSLAVTSTEAAAAAQAPEMSDAVGSSSYAGARAPEALGQQDAAAPTPLLCDAVIVGAGPAGLAAAVTLARRRGWERVVMLEKRWVQQDGWGLGYIAAMLCVDTVEGAAVHLPFEWWRDMRRVDIPGSRQGAVGHVIKGYLICCIQPEPCQHVLGSACTVERHGNAGAASVPATIIMNTSCTRIPAGTTGLHPAALRQAPHSF